MIDIDFKKEEILKFTAFLGFGFYRVTKEGQFLECDSKAREIFGIPQEDKDLSKYSIKDLYVVPAERDRRIRKVETTQHKPLVGTLFLQVKREKLLLIDVCWWEDFHDQKSFAGLAAEIEDSTLLPKLFDTFPMGLFEIDDDGTVVRINEKLVKILKYKNESDIIGKPYRQFCEDQEAVDNFVREVDEKDFALGNLRLRNAENKIIEAECFSHVLNKSDRARWGMVNDITERERAVRAVEKMPTGFYHIEYAENDNDHENERVIQCNEKFAQILGYKEKENVIGINLIKHHHPHKENTQKFFEDLDEADRKGEPLSNYTFKTIRINDNKTIYISVDVHLVKDRHGKVIGREGTIRDITEEIELKNKKEETEKRLEKTASDIHKLLHTLFHPAVKFAGKSKALHRLSNALHQTMQPVAPLTSDSKKLGQELMAKLMQIREDLRKNVRIDHLLKSTLEEKFTKIINIFDYSLQKGKDKIILDGKIRETALWILEELKGVDYSWQNELKPIIKEDFIDFLQGILLNYLKRNAEILMGESEVMNRRIESLRTYISLERQRKYSFAKHDIRKILEENIELFKPILSEKNIDIEPKIRGNLTAEISRPDIDRVISSLLQNVRDYSFKGSFVKVKTREIQPENEVEISVESLGIPIKKDEIERGDILRFGYRGKFSYKSERDGVGVGLADTKDVIDAHGGEISITSMPTKDDGNPPQYKAPYRTTVLIKLPKVRKKSIK